MKTISLFDMLFAFVPVALVIALLALWAQNVKEALYGFARMLLQLSVIGYFLIYLFAVEASWVVIIVLAVMMLVASWISLRTSKVPFLKAYPLALAAIFLGGGGTLAVISQGVLALDPWFEARFIIPLAGMIFAASMNSISLAVERLEAESGRGEVYIAARNTAFRASLIPITNSLFAVGLVSLPGMMTGQILSGISPLVAARYQIMVMCMMYASAGLSAACYLMLIKRYVSVVSEQQS
jgi:putative ABC transport system permease protein